MTDKEIIEKLISLAGEFRSIAYEWAPDVDEYSEEVIGTLDMLSDDLEKIRKEASKA